jgi:hypothetical protein
MAEVSRGWYKTSVELGFGAVEAVPVLLYAYGYFFLRFEIYERSWFWSNRGQDGQL